MNKKLMLGLSAAASAGLFWACGDGKIITFDEDPDNGNMAIIMDTDSTALGVLIQGAVTSSCENAIDKNVCIAMASPNGSGAVGAVSSSSIASPTSSIAAVTPTSTGSGTTQTGGNIVINSSPSGTTTSSPSNGSNTGNNTAASSSSPAAAAATGDPNAWGTCVANATNNAIKKGSAVQWKLSLDNTKVPGGNGVLMGGTFTWTFEGAEVPTISGTGMNYLSPSNVKYPTSGTFGASVSISYNGQSNTIACTPLEVTGAEVSGCVCSPSAAKLDIATSPNVTWTVSGCKSEEATFTYAWSDGFVGNESVTAALPKKGTYAPTVVVKNADNGLMNVTCGEVIATDANDPDYVISQNQIAGAVKIPAGNTIVQLKIGSQSSTVFCKVDRADSPTGAISGTVNGSAIAGNDYVTVQLAAGSVVAGGTLEFTVDVPATCGIQ